MIIMEKSKRQRQKEAFRVEYAQKPHMVIYLDAQSFRITFQANQEDQVHQSRSA